MTTSAELSFQTVLFEQLSPALPGVTVAAGGRPSEALPYVDISESISTDYPVGEEITTTLHIWTTKQRETKSFGRVIRDAVHGQIFTKAEWTFVNVRVDDSRAFLDPDGQTWHGVLSIRAIASL